MDEITIGDKVYVSSKRAAQITGYAKDYVGQLCREGRVEARLVGRNWYVLESAIREHRFGASQEAVDPEPEAQESESADNRADTWQKPSYVAEAPQMVPELAEKPVQEAVSSPAIADMQSAWREWFADKKPIEALPDGKDDFKDEYLPVVLENQAQEEANDEAAPVLIQRITEAEEPESTAVEQESEIAIHKSYDSRETGEVVPATSVPIVDLSAGAAAKKQASRRDNADNRAARKSGSGVARALLIVFAVAFALVAVIGTGNAERFVSGTSIDFGVQKSILDFLGGKSEYKSRL